MKIIRFGAGLLYVIIVLTSSISFSQRKDISFLTTAEGLPTNHVYSTLADADGYLWLATDKGVLRYSGYELKLFNSRQGLANDDVWQLYQDSKKRIWLYSITPEFGYILNEQYHKTYISSPTLFYPKYVQKTKDGIHFINLSSDSTVQICFEKNDTILKYTTTKQIFMNKSGIYTAFKNRLYRITQNGPVLQPLQMPHPIDSRKYYLFQNMLIPYKYGALNQQCTIQLTSILDNQQTYLSFEPDERIYMLSEGNDVCYLISNKNVYAIYPDFKIEKTENLSHYISSGQLRKNDVLTYNSDNFWGKYFTTKTNGLGFICQNLFNNKEAPPTNIVVGMDRSNARCLWDPNRDLLTIEGQSIQFENLWKPFKLLSIARDSVLIISNHGTFLFNVTKGVIDGKPFGDLIFTNGEITRSGEIYLSVSGGGLKKVTSLKESHTLKSISGKRFSNICYFAGMDILIAYNSSCILLAKKNKQIIIDNAMLKRLGIDKIEKIVVDEQYGNVIIKTQDKLISFNTVTRRFINLFAAYKLSNTHLLTKDNAILLVGKFGVLTSTIKGMGKYTPPYLIANFRGTNFSFVNSARFDQNDILWIDTDQGYFSIEMPYKKVEITANSSHSSEYKFLVYYEHTPYSLKQIIDINVKQSNPVIHFDLINPAGIGKVTYEYCISGINDEWNTLMGSELNLSELKKGKRYQICVRANDDIRNTAIYHFTTMLMPYWWQTKSVTIFLWAIGGVLLSGILLLTVSITRKRINKRHRLNTLELEVKNLNLSLELKSLYSQINPHFIFNTLNTTLYYIKTNKMQDASRHISSFSRLLRSYLESSKNKYIKLPDEIRNLEDYIILQQERFANGFNYSIQVDNAPKLSNFNIPCLLLQPLVENAINHGLRSMTNGGELILKFYEDKEKKLVCAIEDNGIGREKSQEFKKSSETDMASNGNRLIAELIAWFNKHENVDISLRYIDKVPPLQGTIALITIKQC